MRFGYALLACLSFTLASPASAQDRGVVTSFVLLREAGASIAQASAVSIGLRRGVRDVEGVDFVHPVDALGAPIIGEELQRAIEELEPVADMVRTGDARSAYQRADNIAEIFHEHLGAVRRTQLVDALMLGAIGRCQAGETRACMRHIRDIIAFRESLQYDIDRYGPESAEIFDRARARALSGARGTLIVETNPPGAEVYVDGRSYGPSPATAEGLLVGDHYVTVKELGYEELNAVAEVRAGRANEASFELEQNMRAQLITSEAAQAAIRAELGNSRAGPAIRSLGNTLGTAQVIVGVLRPAAGGRVHVQLYLYHVTTRLLQAQEELTLTTDLAGMERARQLALDLYEGVDLSGGIDVPLEPDPVAQQPELYEQWWFWTAIAGGVALIAGAIAIGFAVDSEAQVPGGFIRWGGTLP